MKIIRLIQAALFIFCASQAFAASDMTPGERALYEHFYNDTVDGFEGLRGEDGLINDNVDLVSQDGKTCEITSIDQVTTPTNIALDILVQLGKIKNPKYLKEAKKNLTAIFKTLGTLQPYKKNGLFYSQYSTLSNKPLKKDVSSVDNIHLALAFWTAGKLYPQSDFGKEAQNLFSKMHFDDFYDHNKETQATKLGGNLRYPEWSLDPYRYEDLGSESRSVYSIGYALKLFKSESQFPKEATLGTFYNTTDGTNAQPGGPLLAEWQGAAFQLLLPKMLSSEEKYSPHFAEYYKNFADYIVKIGKEKDYPGPAGFSASAFRSHTDKLPDDIPIYNGNAGLPGLVSTANIAINDPKAKKLWDMVLTLHAVAMAATLEPSTYAKNLEKMAKIKSTDDKNRQNKFPLYCRGRGFVDGVHVNGENKGYVVPVQYSLDQGMSILAFEQILSDDGMSTSSRALYEDEMTRSRLTNFYSAFEDKFNSDSTFNR